MGDFFYIYFFKNLIIDTASNILISSDTRSIIPHITVSDAIVANGFTTIIIPNINE